MEVVVTNDMDLRKFPFDSDRLDINVVQQYDENSPKWVFVPSEGFGGVENSVKCYYDLHDTPEFDISGFSLDIYRYNAGE